jgi:predicted phage terminase large subunit-like protein
MSSSSPSSLIDPQVDEEAYREAQRFYQFIREIVLPFEPPGFRDYSEFHKHLIYTAVKPMSATASPRDHLKSTFFSRYRVLHRLVDPVFPADAEKNKTDIFIISATSDLPKLHLDWIARNIEFNPHLIERYGRLRPDKASRTPWNQEEIELTNGNKAAALGYTAQIRGLHGTDIIIDDIEDEENTANEDSIKKLKDNFYRKIIGSASPQTNITVIGTIITKNSLLTELLSKEEFQGKKWKALNEQPDGSYTALWPQRWSVPYLLKRKALIGTHRFNAEYQNDPIGLSDPIVLEEWIKRHTPEDLATLKPVRRYMAVDPAFTEERWGDYSAIIVLDEMPNGALYERLAWRKKVNAPELEKTIINFYYHFCSGMDRNDVYIGIEEVAAQKTLRQHIMEKDAWLGGRIIPCRPDKDKARRLIDVSRYFEMGLVSLMTEGLVEETLDFPRGSKDRVDAMVWALKLYEQQHPLLPQQGDNSPLDHLHEMGQNEVDIYIQKALDGHPGHTLPPGWENKYHEAIALSEWIQEFCD